MRIKIGSSLILVFWAGFVCSISFMEAWLKFQAPGVTREIGLGIGSLVFTSMNRVEWVFLVLYLIFNFAENKKASLFFKNYVIQGIILLVLLLQSLWFLPVLNNNTAMILQGMQPEASLEHFYYIAAEVVKVVLLVVLAIKQLRFRP